MRLDWSSVRAAGLQPGHYSNPVLILQLQLNYLRLHHKVLNRATFIQVFHLSLNAKISGGLGCLILSVSFNCNPYSFSLTR